MQFFDEDAFKDFLGELTFGDFTLFTTDTYNETEISKSILKIDKNICLGIALQLSIIGYGNKKFNKFTYKEKEIDILEYMRTNNVRFDGRLNDKLKPGDLTPRRIIRFYRFAIKQFLVENPNIQSYLFKKYCPIKGPSERVNIFPGFEHIATTGSDDDFVETLVKTYVQLDLRCKTNICDRIIRVLSARGFSYDDLVGYKK